MSTTLTKLIVVAAVATLGCTASTSSSTSSTGETPEQTPAPFLFQNTNASSMQIRVLDDQGKGLSMARVVVRTLDDDYVPGVLWEGFTDANGAIVAPISLRADQKEVQLIVQMAGYTGPYSDETLRAAHPYFAPSSWQVVAPTSNNVFEIHLARSSS